MDDRRTALLAAHKKDHELVKFAHDLAAFDFRLFASKGTAEFLMKAGVPAIDIGDIVGEPIMGHRVVTLDRRIYAAILARAGDAEDEAELKRIKMPHISLVYVNFYPLEDALADPNLSFDSVIEKIDIGGPTLLRAMAKAGGVAVSSPTQFANVINFLKLDGRNPFRTSVHQRRFLCRLAAQAEDAVMLYTSLATSFYQSAADGDFPHRWLRKASAKKAATVA